MKFPNFAHQSRQGSSVNARAGWHRQTLAVATAVLLALSALTPAWSAPPSASPAADTAAKIVSPSPGCQLHSPRGNVSHVVTIIFDHTKLHARSDTR